MYINETAYSEHPPQCRARGQKRALHATVPCLAVKAVAKGMRLDAAHAAVVLGHAVALCPFRAAGGRPAISCGRVHHATPRDALQFKYTSEEETRTDSEICLRPPIPYNCPLGRAE
jgi:hypothetical protein